MMTMMGTHHTRMTKNIAAIATVFLALLQQGMCMFEEVAIKELLVPTLVPQFSNVNLTCRYESARDPLFIKWFHNGLLFLKYQMNSEKPMTIFEEDSAVKVIREQSNRETVVLQEVDLAASGNYTCTVIGEAPKLHKGMMTKTMTVVGETEFADTLEESRPLNPGIYVPPILILPVLIGIVVLWRKSVQHKSLADPLQRQDTSSARP